MALIYLSRNITCSQHGNALYAGGDMRSGSTEELKGVMLGKRWALIFLTEITPFRNSTIHQR